MSNHGLNLALERAQESEKDWKFGAFSKPALVVIPIDERKDYLPIGEIQKGKEDFFDCASRGPNNVLETLFTYMLRMKLLTPENEAWLFDKEYIDAGGRLTFSDRFVAVNSGTTREGNSLKAPLEAIRKHGLIPKRLLPASPDMTFDEYHKGITSEMRSLGKEFAERFTINYEKVFEPHYAELLKEEMIVVGGFAWASPVDGEYKRTDADPNHCFILWNLPAFQAFDNYLDTDGDFIKKLAPDFNFIDYGYRVYIASQQLPKVGILQKILEALKKLLQLDLELVKILPQPIPQPIPVLSNREKLHELALSSIGTDASPDDHAPDEFGCSESLSAIIQALHHDFSSEILSTAQLANTLDDDKRFRRTVIPKRGCIIVSPRTSEINGHCGIWTEGERIISNDSKTGLMKNNYSFASWVKTFKEGRGLRILIWEPL